MLKIECYGFEVLVGWKLKNKGIHWVDKDTVRKEKYQGFFGFQCFDTLNIALLMKQIWRFCMNTELLVSKILKAKYFKNICITEAKPRGADSFETLCSVVGVLENGIQISGDNGDVFRWRSALTSEYSVK